MTYSYFALVCLIIHIVVNIDNFRKKTSANIPALKAYRVFAISVASYFLLDFLWGIFEEHKLSMALYIDTTIYFVIMGFTILSWARYIIEYLHAKGWKAKLILYTGNAFFLAEIVLLILNVIIPNKILFGVDFETCKYTAYYARNIMLYVQILLYFATIAYAVVFAIRKQGSARRNITIALYSVIMSSAIIIQIYDPYLPIYSAGLAIGSVLLNSFVINDIKEDYKEALQESQVLVEQGQEKLSETLLIANTDPLTNVKNKHAYVEEEDRIDKLIASGEMEDFAVVVFDLNGLKQVNDTKGHDAGDVYIVDSCRIIEKYFGSNNLYRFGGDEFVVILTGENYEKRNETITEFEHFIESCLGTDKPIISSGMSKYRKDSDYTYQAVFYRADKIMYSRKDILKEHHNE